MLKKVIHMQILGGNNLEVYESVLLDVKEKSTSQWNTNMLNLIPKFNLFPKVLNMFSEITTK